jgi:hypothetical protein
MPRVAGGTLNERLSFLVATTAAGISTSVLPCLVFPSSSLCAGATSLLSYAGSHFFLSIGLWILVLGAAWLLAGQRLTRPRQNLSTKLRFLAWCAVIGIVIDSVVSVYQLVNSADVVSVLTQENLVGLAGRALLYVSAFAVGVGLSRVIGGSHRPAETPPPRFGRE